MKIGIVGPCAAGKTTLQNNLLQLGYNAVAIAQEHSGVPSMWQQITKPDIVIYLDASLPTINARRNVSWEQAYIDEMNRRLRHARAHADYYLITDSLSIEQVRDHVSDFLARQKS